MVPLRRPGASVGVARLSRPKGANSAWPLPFGDSCRSRLLRPSWRDRFSFPAAALYSSDMRPSVPILILAFVATYATLFPLSPPISYAVLALVGVLAFWGIRASSMQQWRREQTDRRRDSRERKMLDTVRRLEQKWPGDQVIQVPTGSTRLPRRSRWERFKIEVRRVFFRGE